MKLTLEDTKILGKYGISEQTIETQVQQLLSGSPQLDVERPCTINDGIIRFSEDEKDNYEKKYFQLIQGKKIIRFTPASGAATRMFKHLFSPDNHLKLVDEFIFNFSKFAFAKDVESLLDGDISDTSKVISTVLNKEGLNYGNLPKALISFHQYSDEVRKAIDEQLEEGYNYIHSGGKSRFHFTISPEHHEAVIQHLENVFYAKDSDRVDEFEITFSTQSRSTDTIAITSNGDLATKKSGELLLRPGGHGALIHNLNQLDADVVFIKNIDNIVREEYQQEIIYYKRVLGAFLLETQQEIFSIINECLNPVSQERLDELSQWVNLTFGGEVIPNVEDIVDKLNRPIRVCGMVKNEGSVGGGPFWVNGSVQIVETAQLDLQDMRINDMLNSSTHFNPVDIVCGLKDYTGKAFDLTHYIDKNTFFVSSKTNEGEEIRVLEHPGLWNGAMANWLTIFVEVPLSTFHPVKTVNDLLGSYHQPPQ